MIETHMVHYIRHIVIHMPISGDRFEEIDDDGGPVPGRNAGDAPASYEDEPMASDEWQDYAVDSRKDRD